jgi:hypothetical protein
MVRTRVAVRACPDHPDLRMLSDTASGAVLRMIGRVDMGVEVLIGLLHWHLGMKRSEIDTFLRSHDIRLSTGTISNRALDFLLLFAQLHRARSERLRTVFENRGGYVLHVDGTFRTGGRVTFVLQEDRNGLILDAGLIEFESGEPVRRMLESCKDRFGAPMVVVRDGSENLAQAISLVFPDVPQQLCQPHFLRSTEEALLADAHAELKSCLLKHRLSRNLKCLRVAHADPGRQLMDLERLFVHIVVDYLFHPVKHQSKWLSSPLPYYFQYERIKQVAPLVERLVRCNASRSFVCAPLMDLDRHLRGVTKDPAIRDVFFLMHRTIKWMDRMRCVLRISRETHLKDARPDGQSLGETETQLRGILSEIVEQGRGMGGKYESAALSLRNTFEGHWEELFVPVPVVKGRPFNFRRHNNALETCHRRTRKSIRERTGREQTRMEMEQHGDLLAILSNLQNPVYQALALGDIKDLGEALAESIPELPRLRNEYRLTRAGPERPVPDDDRLPMMLSFVQILESSKDDLAILPRLMGLVRLEGTPVLA